MNFLRAVNWLLVALLKYLVESKIDIPGLRSMTFLPQ
jgi:hypothetical protein